MADLNKVLLMGRLTKNPELRYTPGGKPVTDFTLAINRVYKNANGESIEQTCFIDIVVWGKQAESCSQFLQKGRTVFVEGRLNQDKWVSKTGETRSKINVIAERVQFMDRGERRTQEESETSDVSTKDTTPPESMENIFNDDMDIDGESIPF